MPRTVKTKFRTGATWSFDEFTDAIDHAAFLERWGYVVDVDVENTRVTITQNNNAR